MDVSSSSVIKFMTMVFVYVKISDVLLILHNGAPDVNPPLNFPVTSNYDHCWGFVSTTVDRLLLVQCLSVKHETFVDCRLSTRACVSKTVEGDTKKETPEKKENIYYGLILVYNTYVAVSKEFTFLS